MKRYDGDKPTWNRNRHKDISCKTWDSGWNVQTEVFILPEGL